MNKKKYQRPNTKVVFIETNYLLDGSTGANIPDAGWGDAKGNVYQTFDDIESYDE